ncbi:heterokaryon incompatibility protein, partial [Pseudomassariella vexata]
MELAHRYTYSPLPPGCIRVLELHPWASTNAALRCRVIVQQIDEAPYEALSYVWGDKTPYADVHCHDGGIDDEKGENDGVASIGANLAKALMAFRLPDESRRLWVDAVCINQEDLSERQSQVRLMGQVFRDASHVLCWLGGFEDPELGQKKAGVAIDFLRRFNAAPREVLREAQDYLHATNAHTPTHKPTLESWLLIKDLFDVEYFHRAWIIQEVGLARKARLYWGNTETWVDWDEVAAFARFMDDNGASVINYFELKSWVCNHINLVWEMKPDDGLPKFNFVEVLHWARIHRSTDPRDYVYALLGHPSATESGTRGLIVEPDYKIGTPEAYTNLAVSDIRRSEGLHVLAFVDHGEKPESRRKGLPTWVPDWHALNLVAPLRSPTQAAPKTDGGIEVLTADEEVKLCCRGFVLGTVIGMTEMIDPKELVVTSLEAEMKKGVPFLVDHIWDRIVKQPESPLESSEQFIDALSFVLTGGHLGTDKADSGERRYQQRADYAAFILKFEQIRPNNSSPGFLHSLMPEDRKAVEKLASKGSAAQFVQDMTWTSMCRKVFRTKKGHIGLGPRIMEAD